MKIALLTLALTISASAQTAKPAPVLSSTEKIALAAIQKEFQRINAENQQAIAALKSVETDVAKEHPGWHLSERTFDLEADLPASPAKK